MQALEMDMEMDDMELASLFTTRHGIHSPRERATTLVSSSSSLSPRTFYTLPTSRTTPQRQCLALSMIICGMMFSTVMVYNIFNNTPSPWMFAPASSHGVPLQDLLQNKNGKNHTATTSNNATTSSASGSDGNHTRI